MAKRTMSNKPRNRRASRPERADEDRAPLSNIEALNDAIVHAFSQRLQLERQIDALTEKHIAPLKEARTTLMRGLKADTTITGKDVSLFYKLWRRQQDALEVLDEDDRDKVLDDMRTLFNALGRGQMLNFVDVLQAGDHVPAHVREAQRAEAASAEEEDAEIEA